MSTIDDSQMEPFKLKLIPKATNNLIYWHVVCATVRILNRLTAMGAREHPLFNELRWRVVSPRSHYPLLAFDS